MVAIYPGSFDPITNGHLDIIKRAAKLTNKLYVAVLNNSNKKGFIPIDQRVELIKNAVNEIENVEVIYFNGLLVELLKEIKIDCIIKGLRCALDYEYEAQMAHLNRDIYPNAETLFMMCSPRYSFLSSSAVREIYKFGGDIDKYVPKCVEEKIKKMEELL